jgi:Prephenate dehydrogenase
MKILIVGAGKMGSFFTDLLSFEHQVAVYDEDPLKMRFIYNTLRFKFLQEIENFNPDIVINCVTLSKTIEAYLQIIPYLDKNRCILSDIASVKTTLKSFYESSGFRYVSVHPMFGPTFANLNNLQAENAIIINEPRESKCMNNKEQVIVRGTDYMGMVFFRDLFNSLHLNVKEYTFDEHDKVVAYSLSIPFASTMVFGSIMKHQDAPGTTFKKHLAIARGLLSEDDYLLTEILFNPNTPEQLQKIIERLTYLAKISATKDTAKMHDFIAEIRENVR